MELGSRDDFSELFHVGRFDVDNIEALILDVEVPEVNAQVITADESLSIAIDGDAVYVVCVSVGVCSSRDGGDNGVVMGEARQFEGRCISERNVRIRSWWTSTATERSSRGEIVGEIVFRHHFQ